MENADGKPRRLHGRSRAHAMTLGVWALRPLRPLCEMLNGKWKTPMASHGDCTDAPAPMQ